MKTGVIAFVCFVTVAVAAPSVSAKQAAPAPAAAVAAAAAATAVFAKPAAAPAAAATPKSADIYSAARSVPAVPDQATSATSLSGDGLDMDSSVRQRIEADSKKVGAIAQNLVGVQGDINRVEKEVLGKVFDMHTMKSFLSAHEGAIKRNEKLTVDEKDLNGQVTSLGQSVAKATSDNADLASKHSANMMKMLAHVTEDKAVMKGLETQLVPLVEMQHEIIKLPPVNENQTAINTAGVANAQAATQELLYEKAKLLAFQDTSHKLMAELVKQHTYAHQCHERLYQLRTKIHEVNLKESTMKYNQGRESAQGEAMERFLSDKNALVQTRLKKSKTNDLTIHGARANVDSKIATLQSDGQLKLEKLKAELGQLRMQSASIETAMMAKITNRKLIEKAIRGISVSAEDMQEKILAGHLDKLQRNNTQMTNDLGQLREGLQKGQANTVRAESEKTGLLHKVAFDKEYAMNLTTETQNVARAALGQVQAAAEDADKKSQEAQAAQLQAQASQLLKCDALWEKDHPHVKHKLKACEQTKIDLDSKKAAVATLTSAVQSAASD